MKTIVLLIAFAASVFAQGLDPLSGIRAERYRRSGMSMDKNAGKDATPPTPLNIAPLTESSAEFQEALLRMKDQYPDMTAEKLIERVKSGDLLMFFKESAPVRCRDCSGSGKIYSSKNRSPDKKAPCAACEGKGQIITKSQILLVWKP